MRKNINELSFHFYILRSHKICPSNVSISMIIKWPEVTGCSINSLWKCPCIHQSKTTSFLKVCDAEAREIVQQVGCLSCMLQQTWVQYPVSNMVSQAHIQGLLLLKKNGSKGCMYLHCVVDCICIYTWLLFTKTWVCGQWANILTKKSEKHQWNVSFSAYVLWTKKSPEM